MKEPHETHCNCPACHRRHGRCALRDRPVPRIALADELLALERRLADPEVRADPAAVGALLADDFREVGASGRIWNRAQVLAALAASPGPGYPIDDFAARALGDDHALVTFRAHTAAGQSWRTSIWSRAGGAWRLVFHQGTPGEEQRG